MLNEFIFHSFCRVGQCHNFSNLILIYVVFSCSSDTILGRRPYEDGCFYLELDSNYSSIDENWLFWVKIVSFYLFDSAI